MGLYSLWVDPRYVAGGGNEDKGDIPAGVQLPLIASQHYHASGRFKIRYRRWPNLNIIGIYTRSRCSS